MNWLDVGLIVFLLILVIIGVKKGFMTSVLSNFSFSINAILSFFLYKPISFILNKVFNLQNAIGSAYYSNLISKSEDFATNLIGMSQSELPNFVSSTIDKGGFNKITETMFDIFLNKSTLHQELNSSNIENRNLANIISDSFSSFFTVIISFVTSILLLYLLVLLIKLLVKKLRQIGLVKFVDNFLGALYGIFRCLVVLIIICFILNFMDSLSFMQVVNNYISQSLFGKLIFNQINNFIDNYLNFGELLKLLFSI